MYDTATILVIFGSILFVLAIFGGGMSVKEIKIPSIQSRVRILLYPVSIIFIITGVWLSRQPPPTAEFPGNQLPPETTSLTTPSQLETKTPLTDPFSCKVFSDDFETGV